MDSELPINERRSISSHTPTEHGVYDDEPFAVEGLAYYWYQRAVYWKREAHRSDGVQQTMNFGPQVPGLTIEDIKTTRSYIKAGRFFTAIKHIHKITNMSLVDSKELAKKLRDDMRSMQVQQASI